MRFSRTIGRFRADRAVVALLVLGAAVIGGRSWLHENPQHNPWAPLDLNDPVGWATASKIADLRGDVAQCAGVLGRSNVAFEALAPADAAEPACERPDRLVLSDSALAPANPQTTCPVAAGYAGWWQHAVQPAAREILGATVVRVEHLGTYNCRRMYGRSDGPWSEHASGNAIDIAAFVTGDGRRISVLTDWPDESEEAQFLRRVRDGACTWFATVLSPDYNAAHADHLHLDQALRSWGNACR